MRNLVAIAVFGSALFASGISLAAASDAVLLPTAVPAKTEVALHPEDAEQLAKLARQVDAILSEAVQDLGLTLTVSDRSRVLPDGRRADRARA